MTYTREFFNQRSFEVVWAVFRVAEYSAREKMKEVLENKALDYLSKKDLPSLAELEDVVRLAINTKDVSSVNGRVILREVENLRSAIFELSAREDRESVKRNPEKAPNIEEIFSKPPVLASDFVKIAELINYSNEKETKIKQSSTSLAEKNPATYDKKSGNVKNENNEKGSDFFDFHQKNPATYDKKSGNVSEDKQSVILGAIKERNICRLKDLAILYPEMSERTLRYNIQRLIDKGLVERVGSGPSSFLKISRRALKR